MGWLHAPEYMAQSIATPQHRRFSARLRPAKSVRGSNPASTIHIAFSRKREHVWQLSAS
jgi:hypothetical protein